MMNQNDRLLDELRGSLPEYMAQKRMVVGRGKKLIRCINPQHSDSTPSMSYYPNRRKSSTASAAGRPTTSST